MTAVQALTSLTGVLLIGVLVCLLAQRLKLPDALLLVLTGMMLSNIAQFFLFPQLFLTVLALLALTLLVFDSSVRIKLHELETYSVTALKLVSISTLVILVILTPTVVRVLDIPLGAALVFSAIMIGSAPEITLSTLGKSKQRLAEVLKFESIFNTPLTVILPFFIITAVATGDVVLLPTISLLLTKIIAGIGSGIFIGVILFKIIKTAYSRLYTPLGVLIGILLAFVLAENLGGDGIIGVTTLGLFFGTFMKKHKLELLTVESVITRILTILVFVLLGFFIKIPLNIMFLATSLGLFLIYLLSRFLSVTRVFDTFRERIYATLYFTKGLATATVILTLAIYNTPGTPYYLEGFTPLLNYATAFVLYSLLTSTIAAALWPNVKRRTSQ